MSSSWRLVVVPELGGKIVSFLSLRTGREWLWKNPHIPFAKPVKDTTDFGLHDSVGWDEIFPTVNPCSMPGTGWGDLQLTDHGELWYRPWRIVNPKTEAQAIELTLHVEPDDLPLRFVLTLRLTTDALEVDYQLTNTGGQSLPYLWAAHPHIAIEPGNEILIPERRPARAD